MKKASTFILLFLLLAACNNKNNNKTTDALSGATVTKKSNLNKSCIQ
ncbi:MAG: hypothetical protein GXO84_02940 [Chlorobi bacterium]|nr:hypothetical protein [Chlorobiota bacterium]